MGLLFWFWVGFGLISAGWLHYLSLIPQEQVPDRPVLHTLTISLGTLLTTASLIVGFLTSIAPLYLLFIGIFALILALLWFYLLSIYKLPDGALTVTVGDPMLSFTTKNDVNQTIQSDDWRGERILLKFFRGHW